MSIIDNSNKTNIKPAPHDGTWTEQVYTNSIWNQNLEGVAENEKLEIYARQIRDSNQWLKAQVIQYNKEIDALHDRQRIFGIDGSCVGTTYEDDVYNFRIPSKIATHYWYLINRECGDWWANYLCEKFLENKLDVEQFIAIRNLCKYSVLFGRGFMYIKDGEMIPCIVSKTEKDKIMITPIHALGIKTFDYDITAENPYNFKGEMWEVSKDDGVMFIPRTYGIGEYITSIPYLGRILLAKKQLSRNMNFINVFPRTNSSDSTQNQGLAKFITSPFINEVFNLTDGQLTKSSMIGKQIDYITPPQEILNYFDVSERYIDILVRDWYQSFGRPIQSNNHQDLNANANLLVSQYEFIQKEIDNNFIVFLRKLEKKNIIKLDEKEDIENTNNVSAMVEPSKTEETDKEINDNKPNANRDSEEGQRGNEDTITQPNETKTETKLSDIALEHFNEEFEVEPSRQDNAQETTEEAKNKEEVEQ